MAKKIPTTQEKVIYSKGHVPLMQHGAFAEYREFMAAYSEGRLWWAEEAQKQTADPCCKFWFGGRAASIILYALMEAWMRGYWCTRQELREHCSTVVDSAFARVLASADSAGYISRDAEDDDSRQKLIRPTRDTIVMFEAISTRYFKVIVENSHKMNTYTRGLRERVDQIEALDDIRKDQLGWSVLDQTWTPDET